jgi:hypothetical protein
MGIQTKTDKGRFSRLRQSLVQLAGEVRPLVESMISDKPVVRGSVYELRRKCGKPGCKCAKGELHPRMVLSASEGGRTKMRAIPRGRYAEVKIRVRRYQQFRKARARLGEIYRKMLSIIDEMEAMRTESMISQETQGAGPKGTRQEEA